MRSANEAHNDIGKQTTRASNIISHHPSCLRSDDLDFVTTAPRSLQTCHIDITATSLFVDFNATGERRHIRRGAGRCLSGVKRTTNRTRMSPPYVKSAPTTAGKTPTTQLHQHHAID